MAPEKSMERITDKVLPITWGYWDPAGEYGDTQFYNVVFTENFGSFKKNQKVPVLLLSMSRGIICDFDEDGNKQNIVEIKFVPT